MSGNDLSYIKNYDTLSPIAKLPQRLSNPTSFTTNILIVGGAYAGLAALRALKNHISTRLAKIDNKKKVSITLVEPRNGLLNILGIPKAIVNTEFAKTQFIPFNELKDCKFTNIYTTNQDEFTSDYFVEDENFQLNYIHGVVTYLDSGKAQYKLNNNTGGDLGIISFDYVIMANGRDRKWPTTPQAQTKPEFVSEMIKSRQDIAADKNKVISVIGAGAVGIEIAGDIKSEFPDKTVNLIHPHSTFPAEPLSQEFKQAIQHSIERAGINVYLNTRIASEDPDNGNLTTTDNKTIVSNLNFWCTSKRNNTNILSQDLKNKFVSENNNIFVNEYLQLNNSDNNKVDNFFVLGDLVELPIIKSAGWAMYMGRQVANNLTSLIFDNKLIESFLDLSKMGYGMVVIAGNDEIISDLQGVVELNNKDYVQEYKDYCLGKVRATLDL
ncbi:Apoptosis-inducing factor 2 [Spathaspora sp. JA1]|nr:Apoptosis-inducing factor 2 [Spathaspora sp. JA1]